MFLLKIMILTKNQDLGILKEVNNLDHFYEEKKSKTKTKHKKPKTNKKQKKEKETLIIIYYFVLITCGR